MKGEIRMKLGDNIFNLRKDCKLSQEQLAEKINVTRQTISNWELGETAPNPTQLKLLSKALNVSIDELLNNEIKQVLVEKINNTEKLAEIIIKILKIFGIIFVVGFGIIIFINIMFGIKKNSMTLKENQTILLNCQLNGKKYTYLIEYDKDDNIVDASGSDYIINVVKDKQFNKAKVLVKYIESYFEDNSGKC
jgi:transcriptional regulator with XRE-family HTH domain